QSSFRPPTGLGRRLAVSGRLPPGSENESKRRSQAHLCSSRRGGSRNRSRLPRLGAALDPRRRAGSSSREVARGAAALLFGGKDASGGGPPMGLERGCSQDPAGTRPRSASGPANSSWLCLVRPPGGIIARTKRDGRRAATLGSEY